MRSRYHTGMMEYWGHERVACPVCGNTEHLSWEKSPNFFKVDDAQYGKLQIACFKCKRNSIPTRRDMDASYPGLNDFMLKRLGYNELIDVLKVEPPKRKPHPGPIVKGPDIVRVTKPKPEPTTDTLPEDWKAPLPEDIKPPVQETPEKQPVKTPEKTVEPPANKTLWQRIVEFVKNVFKKL